MIKHYQTTVSSQMAEVTEMTFLINKLKGLDLNSKKGQEVVEEMKKYLEGVLK